MKTLRQVSCFGASLAVAVVLVVLASAKPVEAQVGSSTIVMGVGANNPGGGVIMAVNNPNPVFQFWIAQNGSATQSQTCTEIKAKNLGTADPADVTYRLYLDINNNGQFDQGVDTLLGSSSALIFSTLLVEIPKQGAVHFLIVAQVSATAAMGKTVQINIDKDDIKFAGGKRIDSPSEITGNLFTIDQPVARLSLGAGAQVPAADVYVGTVAAPVLQFTLTSEATGNPAVVSSVRVKGQNASGHTATFMDVTAVQLYREHGTPNGIVDGADVQIGGNGVLDSGQFSYEFSGLTETIVAGATRNYLVVVDVAANAQDGHVFVVGVRQNDIVTNTTWAGGLAAVVEAPQTIVGVVAAGLKVENPDLADMPAGAFVTPITVAAVLESGAVDTSFVGQVMVVFDTAPQGAAFTQNSTVALFAVNGVATFSNLILQMAGVYRLKFVSSLLPETESAMTDFFEVLPGNANKLTIFTQPPSGKVGQALTPPPVVHAIDLYGNVAIGFSGQISASLVVGSGFFTGGTASAVNGVATFDNLTFITTGTGLRFVFGSPGFQPTLWSDAFDIVIGDPVGLMLHHHPSNTPAGQAFVPAPQVMVVDAGGNVVTGYTEPILVAIGNNPSGDGVLSGTTLKTPAAGQVVFSDLSINKPGAGYTLVFSSGTLSVTTPGFTILQGLPTKLVIVQQPSGSTGGIAFADQPVVQVQDAGGNLVETDNASVVKVSITADTGAPGALLSGVTSVMVVNGVATFDGLSINKASPTPYSLSFETITSPSLAPATSAALIINVGPAARVGLATQPGLATMGHPFVQQPVAQIQDLGGNLVTTASGVISVKLDAATGAPGAVLQGISALGATGGQAAFTGLSINLPGIGFVLVFESGALLAAHSNPFNVASTATHLAVVVQPGHSSSDSVLSVQPVVEIRDAAGVLVSADNFSFVTAEIIPGTGAPGAVLSGQTSVVAVNGVATFADLKIGVPGLAYTLRFVCTPVLTPAVSTAFNVSGAAVKMLLTRQPAGGDAGKPLTVQPKIVILDNNNIPVVSDNGTVVTVFIQPGSGGSHAILGGTLSLTAIGGVVEFTDLSIDRPGTGYKLVFSAMPVLQQATSASFNIAGDTPPQAGTTSGIPGNAGSGCSTGHESAPWMLLGLLAVFAVARHVSFPRKDLSR